MTHTPSLGVYTDNQLLDELYRRVFQSRISFEFIQAGEGFAQIRAVAGVNGSRYSAEFMAYEQPIVK